MKTLEQDRPLTDAQLIEKAAERIKRSRTDLKIVLYNIDTPSQRFVRQNLAADLSELSFIQTKLETYAKLLDVNTNALRGETYKKLLNEM